MSTMGDDMTEFMKRSTWSRMDGLAAFCVLFAVSFWSLLPTSSFIKEVSVEVVGGDVIFVRELPFGNVTAQWQSEITLLNGYECNSGGWNVANYQDVSGNAVMFKLGDWADKCLEAGPPFYLTTTRRVLLFGIIPLRKSVSITDVQGVGDRLPLSLSE